MPQCARCGTAEKSCCLTSHTSVTRHKCNARAVEAVASHLLSESPVDAHLCRAIKRLRDRDMPALLALLLPVYTAYAKMAP